MSDDMTATLTTPDGTVTDITNLLNRAEAFTAPAHTFATAWHNVSLASGDDKGAPALNAAVQIERIGDDWLRLFATDVYAMHWVTIPTPAYLEDQDDADSFDPPGLDVDADEIITVHDYEGRMKALMGWVWSDTKKDPLRTISMWVGTMESPDQGTLLPELVRRGLIIDAGPERICLPISEHDPIEWRRLVTTVGDLEHTESMMFASELLARVSKLKNVDGRVLFKLHGPFKPVRFTAAGTFNVEGLIMPVRQGVST
jgi:hypothetical protein